MKRNRRREKRSAALSVKAHEAIAIFRSPKKAIDLFTVLRYNCLKFISFYRRRASGGSAAALFHAAVTNAGAERKKKGAHR